MKLIGDDIILSMKEWNLLLSGIQKVLDLQNKLSAIDKKFLVKPADLLYTKFQKAKNSHNYLQTNVNEIYPLTGNASFGCYSYSIDCGIPGCTWNAWDDKGMLRLENYYHTHLEKSHPEELKKFREDFLKKRKTGITIT